MTECFANLGICHHNSAARFFQATQPVERKCKTLRFKLAQKPANICQELVDQALAEEPDNADYLDTLGWILCRQGNAKAGMKQLEKASKLTDGEVACGDAISIELPAAPHFPLEPV